MYKIEYMCVMCQRSSLGKTPHVRLDTRGQYDKVVELGNAYYVNTWERE